MSFTKLRHSDYKIWKLFKIDFDFFIIQSGSVNK